MANRRGSRAPGGGVGAAAGEQGVGGGARRGDGEARAEEGVSAGDSLLFSARVSCATAAPFCGKRVICPRRCRFRRGPPRYWEKAQMVALIE